MHDERPSHHSQVRDPLYWKRKFGRGSDHWNRKFGPKRPKNDEGESDGGPRRKKKKSKDRQESPKSNSNKRNINLTLDKQSLHLMKKTLSEADQLGLLQSHDARSGDNADPIELERFRKWRQDPADAQRRSIELQEQLQAAHSNRDKVDLPMNEFGDQVLQMIADNQYCTIVGETGSGKTTQVPQILLDDAAKDGLGSTINIICTQPRRIAATSVAARVATERGEELGQTVGYHIRHEDELPQYGGSITYCTTGILLKQLSSPDEVLDAFSHIILDEVHERDINLDFTLIMLKRAFIERARVGKLVPKLILMSATIDTAIFQDYFADPRLGTLAAQCPALHVPGRTFPVQRHYLTDIVESLTSGPGRHAHIPEQAEEWIKREYSFDPDSVENRSGPPPMALFTALIAHVVTNTESGAILVFLPGMQEIRMLKSLLIEERPLGIDFEDTTRFQILQLHSLIEQDQRTVFQESPQGVRKIILSTNIAETSVTIPDVTVVIDSGRIRQMQYDSWHRRSELSTVNISLSNLNQRAGRAGRVQAGDYYGLFSEKRIETLSELPVPEMRLANLVDLSLTIRAQRNPALIAEFLADAVEPPSETAVDAAISDLVGLGAIGEDESITSLGKVLARLPLDPALGKLIVLAILFKCLDPIIILGTAADSQPWEVGTVETEQAANHARWKFSEGTFSEHFALLHAYRDIRAAVEENRSLDTHAWCRQNYLRPIAMHHIDQGGRQVEQLLADANLIPSTATNISRHSPPGLFRNIFGPAHLNENSHNESIVRAVLAAGLQPNMAWPSFKQSGKFKNYETPYTRNIGPSKSWSTALPRNKKVKAYDVKQNLPIMLFEELIYSAKTSSTFMSTMTPISPLYAVLFGDNLRIPSDVDSEWLQRRDSVEQESMVVVGRENPLKEELRVRRLAIRVHSEEHEGPEDPARGVLVQFRLQVDQAMERALQKLLHNQPVERDAAWGLFSQALMGVVEADGWDGLDNMRSLTSGNAEFKKRRHHAAVGDLGVMKEEEDEDEEEEEEAGDEVEDIK